MYKLISKEFLRIREDIVIDGFGYDFQFLGGSLYAFPSPHFKSHSQSLRDSICPIGIATFSSTFAYNEN